MKPTVHASKTVAAFALLLLLALPTVVQAQDARTYTEDQKWMLASAQLTASLEASIDDVKTQALKNAIIYATLYRDKVDLSRSVPALRTIYEKDARADHRKLALAALQAIGNTRAADYLARHVSDAESEEGRIVMAAVLNDFYMSRSSAARAGATRATAPSSR